MRLGSFCASSTGTCLRLPVMKRRVVSWQTIRPCGFPQLAISSARCVHERQKTSECARSRIRGRPGKSGLPHAQGALGSGTPCRERAVAEMAGSSEGRVPRKLSWYPFSPADYRADTRHLTRTEHFAYRETLDEIFLSGQDSDPPSIADDEESLSDLWQCESAAEYQQFRRILITGRRALLKSENGRIFQKRMTVEIAKALGVSQKRREAASKRWAGRTETARHDENEAEAIPDHGGNGHGAPTMSGKQFVFYAARVGKWLDEHRDFYHGSSDAPGSAFARAFEQAIGISWQLWQRERVLHQ